MENKKLLTYRRLNSTAGKYKRKANRKKDKMSLNIIYKIFLLFFKNKEKNDDLRTEIKPFIYKAVLFYKNLKTSSKTFFGLRGSAVIEITLFFLIMLITDYFLFDGTRYRAITPHPFWIIILLVSVQYGTNEGVLAATLGSLLLLIFNLPEQKISQDIHQYFLNVTINPILWFVFSVMLGQIQNERQKEIQRKDEDLKKSEEREALISKEYRRLDSLKNTLESRIAGQMQTAVSIYQAVKSLGKLEPEKVLLSISDLVRTIMKPEKFSLFLLENKMLKNVITEGWGSNEDFLKMINPLSPLYKEVIGRQKVLCVANTNDEYILGHEGLLAGPLIDSGSGQIFGMLKIEQLGFKDLNLSNVKNFSILCEWIGTAYHNAKQYNMVKKESVMDHENMLLSYNFFSRQTKFLTDLAKRIGFDVTMILIRMPKINNYPQEKTNLIAHVINNSVKTSLRNIDQAFNHQKNGIEFAIVLPYTPIEGAYKVSDKIYSKIKHKLKNHAPEIKLTFTIQELYRDSKVLILKKCA